MFSFPLTDMQKYKVEISENVVRALIKTLAAADNPEVCCDQWKFRNIYSINNGGSDYLRNCTKFEILKKSWKFLFFFPWFPFCLMAGECYCLEPRSLPNQWWP